MKEQIKELIRSLGTDVGGFAHIEQFDNVPAEYNPTDIFPDCKAAKKPEENYRCIAVPMPCDSPYEYWDSENMEGRGLLYIKHTAAAASLGTIGKNALLLNKQYGNILIIGAILSDLGLTSDLPSEIICMEKCRKCIVNCPVNAIENGTVNQKLCRMHTYGKTKRRFDAVDCNRRRTVCPVFYGISSKIEQRVEANIPAEKKEFAGKAQMTEVLHSVLTYG
jgi:epoxyqueuosine reductase QueG